MLIRPATAADLDSAADIYDMSRKFMRECGNPNQWKDGYPGRDDVLEGIADGTSYVCVDGDEVVGTFYFRIGDDATYGKIYDGKWAKEGKYGVIHRIAVKHHGRGIAKFIFDECFSKFPSLKIDTHRDNIPMQRSLEKCGFRYCGIIHLQNGEERLAYQRVG